MPRLKSDVADEFAELVEAAQWDQNRVAAAIHKGQSYVSKALSGAVDVEPATLALFKFVLAAQSPQVLTARGVPRQDILKESPHESETELWRRRAKTAEQELEELRTGMRTLLDRKPVSSKSGAVVERLLDLAEADDAEELARKGSAAGKSTSAQRAGPSGVASPGSSEQRGALKPGHK